MLAVGEATERREGDGRKAQVRAARQGRTGGQGFEGPQGRVEAQKGRRREVDGEEAYWQGVGPGWAYPTETEPATYPGETPGKV